MAKTDREAALLKSVTDLSARAATHEAERAELYRKINDLETEGLKRAAAAVKRTPWLDVPERIRKNADTLCLLASHQEACAIRTPGSVTGCTCSFGPAYAALHAVSDEIEKLRQDSKA